MPYKSITDLPKEVQSLPKSAKEIWMSAFNNAYKRMGNDIAAFKIAWTAVKKKYKKEGNSWILKKGD